MQMKVRFRVSELREIFVSEMSRRLNRPIKAIDIIAVDADDEQFLNFEAIEFECYLEDEAPDNLLSLIDEQDQPA